MGHEPLLLFTYGTMRKFAYNNGRIARGRYIGQAETCEPFAMVGRKSPRQIPYIGRVPSDDGLHGTEVHVKGDVVLLTPELLYRVDKAEGHPHYYEREMCHVRMDDGTLLQAWVYLFDVHEEWGDPIETGDFEDWYSPELHEKQGHSKAQFFDPTGYKHRLF